MDKVAILVIVVSCFGILWSCVCRLTMTHREVLPRVRYRYVIIGTASLIAPFGAYVFPFQYGGLVGVAIFFLANAAGFWLDREDWAEGVPESATKPGELYESQPANPPVH